MTFLVYGGYNMPDNQGAAGVRLQIIDNSTFTVPVTPLTIGAVAGYSTKGPFNTIIPLESNADVNTILGSTGFQNPKYNQALIAARGLLLGGGGAEFVRIFSETADLTNGKGALKSDAWLVTYNKDVNATTNLTTNFFAATNNVAGQTVRDLDGNELSNSHSDGYAQYGNREIFDVATVASTKEVRDFSLDSEFIGNNIPLFSIIPLDPSSTVRGNSVASDGLNVKTAANESYFATASVSLDCSLVDSTTIDTVTFVNTSNLITVSGTAAPADGTAIQFTNSGGALPAEIDASTRYYVINSGTPSADDFQISTSVGGSALAFTDDGTGTTTAVTAGFAEGDTVTIFDTTFEFDTDSTVAGSNVAVTLGTDLESTLEALKTAILAQGGLLSGIERVDITLDASNNATIMLIKYLGFDYGTVSSNNSNVSIIADIAPNASHFLADQKYRGEIVIKHDPSGASIDITGGGEIADISAASKLNEAMTTGLTETAITVAADTIATGLASVPVGTSFRFSAVPTGMTIADSAVLTTTTYYVKTDSSGTITIAATPDGAALDITAAGSGTLTLTGVDQITLGAGETVAEGDAIVLKDVGVDTLNGVSSTRLYYVTHEFKNATTATGSTFQLSTSIDGDIVELEPVAATGSIKIFEPSVLTVGNTSPSISGDTVEIFGKIFEFTSGTAGTGNTKIGTPQGAGNLTAGQIASLIVSAVNSNDLPLSEMEVMVDTSDSTGTTVILEYRHIGLDNAVTQSRVAVTSGISGVLTARASVDVTGSALVKVDDSNLDSEDQETQPTTSYSDVLIDDQFGIEFEELGLATELSFQDNSGNYVKKYMLSGDGAVVARSYIKVDLTFDGEDRSFSGTLVPLVVDEENLYIVEQTLQYADEFAFIVNDNDALEDNVAEGFIDLGATLVDSVPTSDFVQYAYDEGATDDPTALVWSSDPTLNTFIWSYDPKRNQSSTGLAAAWQLYLDKDTSDVAFFVSAGSNIKNFGKKNKESLDMAVINSVLDVCDKRKDCVALFDAPDYKSVETVIDKTSPAATLGNEEARWGGIWDGRELMDDIFYTKLTIELAKTVGVGNRIMSNTRGGLWWIPPAGLENGAINGLFSKGQKYQRSFNFAGDQNSDIAKLYNNFINPTRVTAAAQQYHGQKTLMRKNSAFQRMNVSMLVAGINKRFEKILDRKVFLLNTRELREEIQSTLQAELDAIKSASPAGITTGTVVCDTSNNTDSIIQQRRLIVDIIDFRAVEAAEFITLRTTVEQSGEGNNISTQII